MIENLRVLGLIPARAGSKGLPSKNVRILRGKPLIGWTIQQAISSKYLDSVLVSTDSEQIASIARNYGATVPFLRPLNLALDNSPTLDVALHALDFFEKTSVSFDILILLEPTSPLRKTSDIDGIIENLVEKYTDFDAVVSLGEVNTHPSNMKKISGTKVIPYANEESQNFRRQDLPPVYFPFGVGYAVKVPTLRSERTFYPSRTSGYIISREQCVEIDDLMDFIIVESLISHVGMLN